MTATLGMEFATHAITLKGENEKDPGATVRA